MDVEVGMKHNSTFLPMDVPTFYAHRKVNDDILEWLDNYQSDGQYWLGGSGVYFEINEDCTMFVLRWA